MASSKLQEDRDRDWRVLQRLGQHGAVERVIKDEGFSVGSLYHCGDNLFVL